MYSDIKIITEAEAIKIVNERAPLGLFVYPAGRVTVGVDNRDGNAWVEEFTALDDCLRWLTGEEDYITADEEWFGVVRWCDEDLRNALRECAFDANDENVYRLRRRLEHHSFTDMMIECGWDVIYQTISETFEKEDTFEEESNG